MAINKGRSYLTSLIEDTVKTFESMLSDIPSYLKENEHLLELEIENRVKIIADGDKEIEENIRLSFSSYKDDYGDLYSSFYASYVLSIYSFYERMLSKIVKENGLKVPDKAYGKSYAIKYIQTIKRYLGNTKIDSQIEDEIEIIHKEFRELRNSLVHGIKTTEKLTFIENIEGVNLYESIVFENSNYILVSLGQIKSILLEIVWKVETLKTKK
jgi:hypothetical protein